MLAPIHTQVSTSVRLPFKKLLHLTNDNLALLGEVVRGDLEVEWGRSLSYAARDVVVGSVARAEPASEVTSLTNGNTSKMGADTCCC